MMGGKEASRGVVYQGFAAVLEALTDKSDWDKISVEYPTQNDKVDIALEREQHIVKAIQVKSTINMFSKADIKKWLGDLINDKDSPKYELYLIGQCNPAANTFMKSVKKYDTKTLDEEAKSSLIGFDTNLLDNKTLEFYVLPFDLNVLQKIVRDSLHHYISYNNLKMSFDQIDFIALAAQSDLMISSTHGKGIDRKEFNEEMDKRIRLLVECYSKRISIGIQSFDCRTEYLDGHTENCISFIDKFKGRDLKNEYDWDIDIYGELESFLMNKTNQKDAYQIYLDTHLSIAFAAGRIFNSKAGINIVPMQKMKNTGIVLWDVKRPSVKNYDGWNVSYETLNAKADVALVLNVTYNIHDEVERFIKEDNLPIGRIINCAGGSTNISIEDGTHAAMLANSVYDAINGRSAAERCATLHIFACAPSAFMFFLGQSSMGFGKCVLYEYDFEHKNIRTYLRSMQFD